MIADVFYLPELKNNLLSIGQLQERKLAILMEHGECKIYHHERGLLMSTQMSANRMFILLAERETQVQAQVSILTCFKTTSESPADLWHRRYGHLHFKGLSTLSCKKMVNGLPHLSESSAVCTICMIGKQHREIIPRKSMWRATQKLQLIHADICGPITPESNSHKRYILTFTDDYSRKLWTYFLNLKSETLAMFKKFKSLVEKEYANVICCLRTDRGGEFTSSDFNEYCSSNGIVRQLKAAYTPQQNGVAERKNRMIMNMVRCMLTEKLVPKIFWPEAVNWAIHLLNRCPTFAVKDKTPEEAWSGFKPSVEYFKVFSCIGHVHIPDKHRQKLDDKSHRCVFLGLSQESKAYRMYDPVSTRIIMSRDVVFEEDKQWNWGTEETGNQILAWGENTEAEQQVTENAPAVEQPVDNSNEDNVQPVYDNAEENDNAEEEQQVDNSATGDSSSATGDNSTRTISSSSEAVSGPVQGRVRRIPAYLQDYVSGEGLSDLDEEINLMLFTASNDRISFEEAAKSPKWREAMDLEIKSIEKNGTWELTTLPHGAKQIGVKWVFKTKLNENGKVDKLKARLVAKGFSQKFGIDYTEVFAPIARWDTI